MQKQNWTISHLCELLCYDTVGTAHPVMQQLKVFRVGQPQSDLRGAAGMHTGPDGSTQEGPQQLQWPALGQHAQHTDCIKQLPVPIQEVHCCHLQVSTVDACCRFSSKGAVKINSQEKVKQPLSVSRILTGRGPYNKGLGGREVSELVHQYVQSLIVLL